MNPKSLLLLLVISLVILYSCKKENKSEKDCLPGATTIRYITNASATVFKTGAIFYIGEDNTIDTRLRPCTLDKEFQVNNLKVIVSGEVKHTIHVSSDPCCTEDFVITQISKL